MTPSKFFYLFFLTLVGFLAIGQNQSYRANVFKITNLELNEVTKSIDIELNAMKNGRRPDLNALMIGVKETKGGTTKDLDIISINPTQEEEKSEELTLLFLIDVSGSMKKENRFENAIEAVRRTVKRSRLPSNTHFFIATFEDEVSENIPFTRKNVNEILETIEVTNNDTELYRAIVTKIDELKKLTGKKVIIILSDGKDDPPRKNRKAYEKGERTQIFEADALVKASEVDSASFYLFPVGLGDGADINFLTALVDSTANEQDTYSFSETPAELDSIFTDVVASFGNSHSIKLKVGFPVYTGDERSIQINWNEEDLSSTKNYRACSTNFPCVIGRADESSGKGVYWLTLFLIGAIILFAIFAVLSLLVPLYKKREFKSNYVVPYRQLGPVREIDPATGEAFEEGQLVVTKCSQKISLDVWEGLGGRCPNYPECMSYLGCAGGGRKETHENFFSQKGILKKFNWLWFGGVGGFIGWILFALYSNFYNLFAWYRKIFLYIAELPFLSPYFEEGSKVATSEVIANEAFVGFALGTGLTIALAYVEEKGAPKFSIGKMLLRVLLGTIVSFIVFMGGAILQQFFISNSFISGLITWIIFGILLGMVLSVQSTISLSRGVLGALLAALVCFLVYFGAIKFLTQSGFGVNLFKMISYIALGCILGIVVVSVVSRLEDFEIEYLTPSEFGGFIIPISKWLKQGMNVNIGSASGSYVYVKWNDPAVQEQHATLTFDSGRVFIEPMGETLVNNVLLPYEKKTLLKNGDIIQLGRDSISQMLYKEKRSGEEKPKLTPHKYKAQQYEMKRPRGKNYY